MVKRGYLFAELRVLDSEVFYQDYMSRVEPILKKYEARFLVSSNVPEVLEGGRNVPRVIILEFSSVNVAKDFYYSQEYQEIITYRFRSAYTHLYILDGLPVQNDLE
ncbi:hypothetical protein SOASR032_03480 [Pragia fontium]|uniref:DUF1330 domain-containing protein n=1 Tax=Pragia fontium TaxID=82985 RepID=A0ABQ5LDT8_9GAMM|nr:DUF1330 domain-containing protein [Pragia fontium]GKX61779.1 hypothetical protein SOASR032_03480 [Pragia fontium]